MSQHLLAAPVNLPVSRAARTERPEQRSVLQTVLSRAPRLRVRVGMIVPLTASVEIARVVLVVKLRYEVCLHPQDVAPVYAVEVVVLLHLKRAAGPESLDRSLSEEESDHVLGLGLHRPVLLSRPLDVVIDRVGKQLLGSLSEEGNTTNQKLIQDHSHAPPVHWLPVALSQYHLMGE